MVRKITRLILSSYYKPVDKFVKNPLETQSKTFEYLIGHGRRSTYGKEHAFGDIASYEAFNKNVPVISYEDLRPYLDRIIVGGEKNVLWDTPVRWFAMSSGTTEDKSKYIPVTKESLINGSYRAGYHMLAMYSRHYKDAKFMFGKTLVMGGSQQENRIGDGFYTGDISAILMRNLPGFARRRRTPENIALLQDWEEKLRQLIDYSLKTDIRAMVGVPSWMLVFLKQMVAETGRTVTDIWPNIEVFFHGGVSFTPFEEQYKKLIQSDKMRYWETYNASEGFFGVQFVPESRDMLLLLDNEVFYEFIPKEDWDKEIPLVVPLEGVETGKQYAMLITTSGGLWRYKIGDTVEFSSTKPYLFRLTGRTKQFINAFGEELIVDNADRAVNEACKYTNAKITEYSVAPVYFDENHNGAHEWLIEFEREPADLEKFTKLLDDNLKKVNSDYEAKRSYDLSLGMPIVRVMREGTFYGWMKTREKVGGQNKVPKLSNDRKYVEDILKYHSNNS